MVIRRTPLHRGPPWNFRTQYAIVNWCIVIFWLLRILSPAAWILSLFQVEDRTGRPHAAPRPTELYVLIMQCCVLLLLAAAPHEWLSHWAILLMVVLLIVEVCQYHAYIMIIRPAIDRAYIQYNFARTIILTLISYQGLISLFAIVYLSRFSNQFNVTDFNSISAWSLSAGILTGTGFS